MFIIFGTRDRLKASSRHGQFFCPSCAVSTTYAELWLRSYVHIFFIPLLRISEQRSGIRCLRCHQDFDESAAVYMPESMLEKWNCPECGREWPETNVRCPFCRVRPDGTPA